MHHFIFDVRGFVKCPLIINFLERGLSSQLYVLISMIISIPFQWSSSHEERTKVIEEGLLNPSADILEAMAKTEAPRTGRIPYLF